MADWVVFSIYRLWECQSIFNVKSVLDLLNSVLYLLILLPPSFKSASFPIPTTEKPRKKT